MRYVLFCLLLEAFASLVDVAKGAVNTCFEEASSDFRDCNAGAFSTTSYPGELSLNDCGLVDADIPEIIACFETFGRDILDTIDLGGNNLEKLPANMLEGSWPRLIGFELDRNNISNIPAGLLSDLSNLEYLNLAENSLVELPEGVFDGLTELESLDLSNNMLTELPVNVFSDLEGMEVLKIANNLLEELRVDVFDGIGGRFTILYLSQNNLSDLPQGLFSSSTGLNSLELAGNNFTTLPEDIFLPMTELITLDLSGNDNLVCVPDSYARVIILPDDFDEENICEEAANTCSNGLTGFEENGVCCLASCDTCGGVGCSKLPGGPDGCCTRAIWESGVMCDDSGTSPCIVGGFEATPCSNGISGVQSGDICCSAKCIRCGGSGCGRRPGGGDECCLGAISLSGVMCNDSGAAPCILEWDLQACPKCMFNMEGCSVSPSVRSLL